MLHLPRSSNQDGRCDPARPPARRRAQPARALLPLACLCLLLSGLPSAWAQGPAGEPSAADRATAQALFEKARELLQEERYEEACKKLEESQRLDPAPGTQANLADCYERIGKTASAWINFLEVAAKDTKAARAEAAKERAAKLEPKLVRLVILVPHKVDGLEITRDGNLVREPQWGMALPIDPGKHTLTAKAPGKKTWSQEFEITEDKPQHELSVAELEDAPVLPKPDKPKPKPDKPEPVEPANDGTINLALALAAGGVGVVGIAVGTAFGVIAMSKNDESFGYCLESDPNRCDPEGVTLRDEALTAGNISTAGFVIGGVGLAAGLVLWLTAPSAPAGDEADQPPKEEVSVGFVPAIAGEGGTVVLQGTW